MRRNSELASVRLGVRRRTINQRRWLMKEKKTKRKKWIKLRHRMFIRTILPFLGLHVKRKYGVTVERFKNQEKRPYLVLMNHQTGYDQFFVYMAFRGPIYSVATEDIFSMGFVSKIIRFLVAPIPIKKSTHDAGAVMNCIRVAKEGASIAIFPEGNRTYSGKTEYISPAIAKLARMLKLPIAFMRIEGGYGVQPRWSDVVRKGKMRAYVSRVMEVDEVKNYTADELYEIIKQELYVNENVSDGEFVHEKTAEYIERAMYVCPYCGLSEFESHDDVVECKKCHRQVKYSCDKRLQGVGFEFPFAYMGDWYDYQSEFVSNLDLAPYQDEPVYQDEGVALSDVVLYQKKRRLKENLQMRAYNNRFAFADGEYGLELPFDDVTAVTVLGKNKLNIYYDDSKKAYQIKGSKRFNALKYVQLYYHYRNTKEGNPNGKFLGL